MRIRISHGAIAFGCHLAKPLALCTAHLADDSIYGIPKTPKTGLIVLGLLLSPANIGTLVTGKIRI